ncbi:ABC transporter permease [Parablautia muri]|uniref:ABC transporter permease n=1 Tax=Parablautia muri TaxID=2320879 RepID=A0A9X5BG62_9FIRM|nr:ABC-2 family transporter protein [Parablautia muri]NBJ93390.1 hypothetical protein [Parablautia muri]
MKFYIRLFGLNLKSQMRYKFSLFLSCLGQFITAFTSFFSIKFIFMQIDAVGGFTYEQVLLCFSVMTLSFSIGEAVGGGLANFPRMVNIGEFDRILTRPRNLILQVMIPYFDFTRIGLLVQGAIVLGLAIPLSGITWKADKIAGLVLMIICGAILFFCLFMFQASFAFFTMNSLDFLNIFTYGARQFGRYPFSVYGKKILYLLTFCIPLALIQYYPLQFLMDETAHPARMFLPCFSLLFILPCRALFELGIRKYKSAGS